MIRILFAGDVVGRPGRELLCARAASLRAELGLTFIIANAENSAAGAGITGGIARELLAAGIDGITLGDHLWDQKGFDAEIGALERVCRPANLPAKNPGRTSLLLERDGVKLGVFTVLGRQYLNLKSSCPFLAADRVIEELKTAGADLVFAEVHAEATSEKIALGRYLDGRAVMVVGTHTHVPTADACVLPGGTAYLTDAGMTGPYDSVLGRDVQAVIGKFLDGLPRRFEVATGDVRISAALAEIDPVSKRAVSMRLLTIHRVPDDAPK
jgi:2',3'-cyclic-nucleotide 2'-phosphodiesterase